MQPASEAELDRVFQALSDRTRRSILGRIAKTELSITEIAEPYDLTFAAVSKHLKVLEQARLIARRRDGSFQMITLDPEALKSAGQWLEFYQQFWTTRLDSLKHLLENEDQP